MWTLANHPRVPTEIRTEVARWGMCRDEFVTGQGWQDQLYIREARRMVSDLVMTQHHCQGRAVADDPIGLAAYTMDSHHVQRHVDAEGFVRNEGDVQVGGFSPYGIGYRAIVPGADQCGNLLVPVCLSSSHMAFGSIRMEPVFMVLGQSAGTAAVQAIEQEVPVQQIDTGRLRERLLTDGSVLEWTKVARPVNPSGVQIKDLAGIVIDDTDAKLTGFETHSTSTSKFVAAGYRHDGNTAKGQQTAVFELKFPDAGNYEIRLSYSPHPNRATNVPVTIQHARGEAIVQVNQQAAPALNGLYHPVGRFSFEADKEYSVEISNRNTDGYVVIDSMQAVKIK